MQLSLGNKIRELRRRDGRTQEALAEALGVTSQAVSRWEGGGSYPDMELLPSIANYFGVTIDELFGYNSVRSRRIDLLAARIHEMITQNNGVDVNMDECIATAREALIEFPGNERLMLCLASALYTAGYVRHGERHLTDAEGYSVYDVESHRGYAEWAEAIALDEKALKTLEPGELRNQAVSELSQLYLNVGAHDKALALAESAPDIWGAREFLRLNAYDGGQRVRAYGETLLKAVSTCARLMVHCVIASADNMNVPEKIQSLRGAISQFDLVCTDGNAGEHSSFIAKMYMLLSLYLWLDDKQDEAFEALDKALMHDRRFEAVCAKGRAVFTAPLVRLVEVDVSPLGDPAAPVETAANLPEDWPWWSVPEASRVKTEMQADPRWEKWVAKTR